MWNIRHLAPEEQGEAIEQVIQKFNYGNDHQALFIGAAILAQSEKDVPWGKILASPRRKEALEALDLEFKVLMETNLIPIEEGHKEFSIAEKESCPGRILVDIKRSGKVKVRAVRQGFKDDLNQVDGPSFNYHSHMATLTCIRMALMRPNRGMRNLCSWA